MRKAGYLTAMHKNVYLDIGKVSLVSWHGRDVLTRDHGIFADLWAREIIKLQAKERQDEENVKKIRANQRNLEDENEAIADLEAFYGEVTKNWSDINFHRNIGHVQYAAAITVDVEGGALYTSDWAAFLAAEAKVRDEFEGNVVDLGAFRLIFLIFTSSNENNLI